MLRTSLQRTTQSALSRPATQFTRVATPLCRRAYADAAPAKSDNLKLSLSVPHKSIFSNKEVTQVNLPSTAGDMGILSHHVPTIVQLKPGIVEIITEAQQSGEKYFVSGGFATVQPGNLLSINAVEAYSLEDFSAEAIRTNLAEAQKVASGSGSEEEVAEAKIELEVYEALQAAGIR